MLLMAGAEKIASLLAGTYHDPESGDPVRVDTQSLVIAPTLAGQEDQLVRDLALGQRIAVVSDPATHAVLGQRIERAVAAVAAVESIVLENGVLPDSDSVAAVRAATARADALIAVGSGTMNDICKYASAQDGKPYAVFATAPSMNGYTSYNAAITRNGHKLSLPAQAPRGAFFDLEILAAAPVRLIRAGLGDSLCRTTAQADWLLAHELFGGPFRELPYALLADDEAPLFDHAADLVAGDLAVMERLVRTLVLAGFGTAIVGNSQPASQGEHLISHYIDMFSDAARPLVFHGEQVGVTTLSMLRLQEHMLETRPTIIADTSTEAEFRARYGDELGLSCWAEFAQKQVTARKAEHLNDLLADRWTAVRDRIRSILLTTERLKAVLTSAGSDLTPEAIHLSSDFYQTALLRCREIRNRYTFLDLAADAGWLAGHVTEL